MKHASQLLCSVMRHSCMTRGRPAWREPQELRKPPPSCSPGLRVGVYERSKLRPRGASLAVQPNGIRVSLEATGGCWPAMAGMSMHAWRWIGSDHTCYAPAFPQALEAIEPGLGQRVEAIHVETAERRCGVE